MSIFKRICVATCAMVWTWSGAWSGGRIVARTQDSPRPQFEVASVKPSRPGVFSGQSRIQPGGFYTATGVTLEELILRAYRLQSHQLAGGADWTRAARFDITAKAEAGFQFVPSLTVGPFERMLQSLLADRFTLAVHSETRELPIYALVLARSDKQLGPQLHASTSECSNALAPGAPPPPPPANGAPACGTRRTSGRITGNGIPLAMLANLLTNQGRPVVDRTGLSGAFDFDFTYSPQESTAFDPMAPSVFTALQEQLGLKLESTRGPIDVLVVDHAAPPTPD